MTNLIDFPKIQSKSTTPTQLKLCLCPVCNKGREIFGEKRPISWILIIRIIIYSLMEINKGKIYF